MIKGKDSIQEPDNPSKREKDDSIIDEIIIIIIKHLHHLKINFTTEVILMIRHVNLIILQVILVVVQETWEMNIKMKNMKNTLKIHLKKIIISNQKLVKGYQKKIS